MSLGEHEPLPRAMACSAAESQAPVFAPPAQSPAATAQAVAASTYDVNKLVTLESINIFAGGTGARPRQPRAARGRLSQLAGRAGQFRFVV